MFELNIKNADGSLHWKCSFNSMEELNAWLAEEKSRFYWMGEYTTQVVDNSPPPLSDADKAAIVAKKSQLDTLKQRLGVLAGQPDMTAADIKETLMKFVKMKVLQGEL